MEMHLVHIRAAYGNDTTTALDIEECIQNGRICGLAVVGILFHVGKENNTIMEVRSDYSTLDSGINIGVRLLIFRLFFYWLRAY